MTYSFRYKVITLSPPSINDGEVVTLNLPGLPEVHVSVEPKDDSIGRWTIFQCHGFESEHAAQLAGEHFGQALITMGAINGSGIDLGRSKPTLQFSDAIHTAWRKLSDLETRMETHGLITFETRTITIIGSRGRGLVAYPVPMYERFLSVALSRRYPLTTRQYNCATLLNDSMFVQRVESAFLLHVSSVESLCDESDVDPNFLSAVEILDEQLTQMDMADSIREVIRQNLKRMKKRSIRQSYLTKFRTLVSNESADRFDKLYHIRSKFLIMSHCVV
jgi:hypothetical protein